MFRLAEWRRLFRLPPAPSAVADEVDAELDFHLRMRMAELQALGLSEGEARAQALGRFGDLAAARRDLAATGQRRGRRTRRADWLGDLSRDLRFAARAVRREPGFAVVAMVVLGLGVGVTTAMVSIADRLALRPLPFPNAARLGIPTLTASQGEHSMMISPTRTIWEAWSRIPLLERVEAHRSGRQMLELGGRPLEIVAVREVTPGLLPSLGAEVALGHGFFPEDTIGSAPLVSVLSWGAWQRRFGADPGVLGRAIRLDRAAVTIVGVLRPGFDLTAVDASPRAEIWLPLRARAGREHASVLITRRPEVSWEQITTELTAASDRLPPSDPPLTDFRPTVQDANALVSPGLRRSAGLLTGAAGLVLLVAVANIAALLLSRAVRRFQEFGVRAAIGAGRGRVVRQLATEALLLGAVGGVLGMALGRLMLEVARKIRPENLRALDDVTLSPAMMALAIGVSLLAAVGFGLAPIWAVSRTDAAAALIGRSRRSGDGRGAHRLRAGLVVGQLAVSVTLLVGAGLLVRSYLRAHTLPLGLEPRGLGHVWFELPEKQFPNRDQRIAIEQEILAAARSVPGVRQATLSGTSPLEFGVLRGEFLTDGSQWPSSEAPVMMPYRNVSPDFFAVTGIPLVAGRPMSADTSVQEIVIDESTARRYWPNGSAIGQRVKFNRVGPWHQVVGVAADQRIVADAFADAVTIYTSAWHGEQGNVVVRFDRPRALAEVGAAIGRVHPDIQIRDLVTAEGALAAEFAARRFSMALVVSFAVLALVLASVGLYGAIALSVAQRNFEIGVRMALGATPMQVRRMVLREGVDRIALALGLGAVGVGAVGSVMRALLYRSSPWDPTVFLAAAALLGLVSSLAIWLPARRASRVDPLLALRCD